MPELTADKTALSPKLILFIGTVATAATALFLSAHPLLQSIDTTVENELLRASADLLHQQPAAPIHLSGFAALIAQLISSLCFAAASALIGFKLKDNARPIALLQLFILSIILISLVPVGAAQPTELWLSIVFGLCIGIRAESRQRELLHQQQLSYELKLRNQQLEQSELLLVKTDETDKRIFAADLHDRVLNDIKMAVKEFTDYKKIPDETKARKITNLLNDTMTDMRSLMDELNPVMLECFGLAAAIEDCAETFTKRGGFNVAVENHAEQSFLQQLSQVEQQLIYRLVQESLTNAYKHSAAELVTISLGNVKDGLIITVADNGKGMNGGTANQTSRGLKYMKMRAALIGAAVNWMEPESGTGTVVQIQMPIRTSQNEPGE